MPLRLYRGSLDSDMIESCFEEIKADAYSKHLVIIPEHYSYEMERMAVDSFGVIGVNNIEVVTPHRMAVNCLLTDTTAYLNPAGKQMLVVCAVNSCLDGKDISDDVRRIMGSRSFTANMVTLISEFKRHMITPQMLLGCAEAQKEKRSGEHLSDKLTAAAAVYAKYDELLNEKSYIDMDDDISRLADKLIADIPRGKRLKEADDMLRPKIEELKSCIAELKAAYEENGSPEIIENEIAELKKRIAKLEEEKSAAEAERETAAGSKKAAATRKINKAAKDIEAARERLNDISGKAKMIEDSCGGLNERVTGLRGEIDRIKGSALPGTAERVAVYGSTRVWFMCFDEYLPHHMKLVRAAVSAAKEVTVCLHYVKSSDKYDAASKPGMFDTGFSSEQRDSLARRVKEIYNRFELYTEAVPNRSVSNISRDSRIYSFMEKSYNKLMAEKPSEERFFARTDCVKRSREIDFLVKHYGFLDRYDGEVQSIEIAGCDNPHREIEYAAETIHTLVRESEFKYDRAVKRCEKTDTYAQDMAAANAEVKELLDAALEERGLDRELDKELLKWLGAGKPRRPQDSDMLRYRDFGILFGGASDYTHILDAIFSEHEIRYFADDKIILSEHPIAVQLLSVFEIYETNWSYESMLRFLNAGFIFRDGNNGIARLDAGEIARLDNYVVRYDIRGRQAWTTEWEYCGEIFAMTWEPDKRNAEADRENERVNALRRVICAPLEKLIPKDADEKRRAAEYVGAMYAFLADILMYEGLHSDVRRFENAGAPQLAQQFGQIWNKLLEVINQISVTMGDMEISFTQFGEYLRAGLSQCEITTIPSSLDAVYTGTVERSTSKPVKKLFIMGAVSGTYPSAAALDGFFTDIDRSYIRGYEGGTLDLAPTKSEQRTKQRYKVYKAIRTATQSISVTYPMTDNEGGTMRTSAFITDISDMFGIEAHSAFPQDPSDERNITSQYAAKRGLVINSAAPMSRLSPVWRSVYRCFRDDGSSNTTLDQIALAASFYSRPPRLMPETAQNLYTRRIAEGITGRVYSATNLDSYAACPMQYFMQYGLRLAEDVQGGVQANEIGTYVHRLVQTVCDSVYTYDDRLSEDENARNCSEAWRALEEDELNDRIGEQIVMTKDNLSSAISDYNMRGKVMERIRSAVSRSAANVLRSLKYGKFVLKASELKLDNVRLMPEEDIYIKGCVDRVDEFRYDDGKRRENLLRIIDYKTGNTDFSEKSIENGRNMQLMVYAIAAALQFEQNGGGEKYSLSGVYYQHMRDKYTGTSDFGGDSAEKQLYLDGQTYLPDKNEEPERRQRILDAIDEQELYIGLSAFVEGRGGKNAKTEEDRDRLIGKVKENIRNIDKEIMSGRIAPRPYHTGSNAACDICRFKDICSYESVKSKRYSGDGFGTDGGGE